MEVYLASAVHDTLAKRENSNFALSVEAERKESSYMIRPAFNQVNRPGFSVSKGQGGPSNPPQASQSKPTTKLEPSQSKQSQRAVERLKSEASPGSVSAPITIDGKSKFIIKCSLVSITKHGSLFQKSASE